MEGAEPIRLLLLRPIERCKWPPTKLYRGDWTSGMIIGKGFRRPPSKRLKNGLASRVDVQDTCGMMEEGAEYW